MSVSVSTQAHIIFKRWVSAFQKKERTICQFWSLHHHCARVACRFLLVCWLPTVLTYVRDGEYNVLEGKPKCKLIKYLIADRAARYILAGIHAVQKPLFLTTSKQGKVEPKSQILKECFQAALIQNLTLSSLFPVSSFRFACKSV
jgi:hypothetical protein